MAKAPPDRPTEHCSPHLAHHVHHGRLAALYYFDRFSQSLDQIFRLDDRPRAPATIGPRHGAKVDVGIFDTNPDGLVFHRTLALNRNSLLMFFVVEIRTVAANDAQEWNLVMHRSPNRAHRKKQIAVGLNIDAELARSLVR